ncbi:MAG: hypothetical protein HYT79_10535 [Elusimicrobia bacterium]|nr:hypothetical protein [Elusimicrobiota bacterium]
MPTTKSTAERPAIVFCFCAFLLLPALGIAASTATANIELSTGAVLAKIQQFDNSIERAIFRFNERFYLAPTGEESKLDGRVYFDRMNKRVRMDYSGKGVKYKVWLDKGLVFLYDESLKQLAIRRWDDFTKVHFQAFMNIPVFFDVGRFMDRYDFSSVSAEKSSPRAEELKKNKTMPALVYVRADPKMKAAPYYLVLGVDVETGQTRTLDLVMPNYEANLTISEIKPKAKFSDKMFDRNLPSDVAILDLTKGNDL